MNKIRSSKLSNIIIQQTKLHSYEPIFFDNPRTYKWFHSKHCNWLHSLSIVCILLSTSMVYVVQGRIQNFILVGHPNFFRKHSLALNYIIIKNMFIGRPSGVYACLVSVCRTCNSIRTFIPPNFSSQPFPPFLLTYPFSPPFPNIIKITEICCLSSISEP